MHVLAYGDKWIHERRAIKVGSERADVHTNYGIFLEEIRRDLDAAEECYKRAVEADDTDVVALCHYGGVFLRQVRIPSFPQKRIAGGRAVVYVALVERCGTRAPRLEARVTCAEVSRARRARQKRGSKRLGS